MDGRILRLNKNVISNSVRRLRGKQRIPAVVSRVITFGLERGGGISNLTRPDLGTSVQPGPGSFFCGQLSPMNSQVFSI